MKPVTQRLLGVLHQHQQLSNTTGVIAGFVGAVSLLFGVVASRFAPHGWHRIALVLHVEQQPFIGKLEPVIGGIALALAIAAALLRFTSWCLEREHRAAETADDAGSGGARHPRLTAPRPACAPAAIRPRVKHHAIRLFSFPPSEGP